MRLPVADYIVWMTITASENCAFNLLAGSGPTFPPDSYIFLHPDPNAHYVAVDTGSVITVTAVYPATSMSHGPVVNIALYCQRLNDPGNEHPIAHARLTAMPFLNTVT
jgi:hypothetical protein